MLYLDKLFIILMKKLLYAAMLLLGVGIMAVSCKKDNSENYENAILGEWIRKRLGISGYITKQMLEHYGKTYVTFRKYEDGVYLLDF